jgi:hypothetical protein
MAAKNSVTHEPLAWLQEQLASASPDHVPPAWQVVGRGLQRAVGQAGRDRHDGDD